MANDNFLHALSAVLHSRKSAAADQSYTASLYCQGEDAILKKIGEEATELLLASKSGQKSAILHEMADLLYHNLVLLAWHDLSLQQLLQELQERHGTSGLEEKRSRQRTAGIDT